MRDCGREADAGGEWVDLREVVVEHHRDIFRYTRMFTHNDGDAEDLAQSAVVRALQRGTIVSDAERALAYVKRIVRNLATDHARARARVSIEPRAEVPDLGGAHDELDDSTPDRRDVGGSAQVAFAGLDAADREVLRLRYLDELAYRTVADRLQTTEHAARQRVYRAMQALRAALKPPDTDQPDTDQRDTDQPDTDQPDTDQRDTDQPDGDAPEDAP